MKESHPYEQKMIPAAHIHVNHIYQRGIRNALIRKIVSEFDYHLVNPVKVTYHNGEYYAWDGQHTATALRTKFGDDYLVPCMIYYDVPTWVNEAELFEKANHKQFRKAVSEVETWKSRLARGEETAATMKKIVERYGLRLDFGGGGGSRDRCVRALAALDEIFKYGEPIFEETIRNVAEAFDGSSESLQSPFLRGMGIFVKTYTGEYDRKALINRLRKHTAAEILRAGKARVESGNKKYADEIRDIYNKKTRNPLPRRW